MGNLPIVAKLIFYFSSCYQTEFITFLISFKKSSTGKSVNLLIVVSMSCKMAILSLEVFAILLESSVDWTHGLPHTCPKTASSSQDWW